MPASGVWNCANRPPPGPIASMLGIGKAGGMMASMKATPRMFFSLRRA
ncbi:MAG TPA: hypothetical protein VNA04_02025 [Thermoanaerobaculia bacterium]|nr:hypothetical protein [Thermoanaerobaculia bacterium]